MRLITAEGIDHDGNLVRIDAEDIMSESDWLRWRSWPEPVLLERLADEIYSLHYMESGSQRGKAIGKTARRKPRTGSSQR